MNKSIVFFFLGIVFSSANSARFADSSKWYVEKPNFKPSEVFQSLTGGAMYGYTTFNFNNSIGGNFNQYNGFSNLYAVGTDQIHLWPSLLAGIYVFRIDTNLSSQLALSPNPTTFMSQNIYNNTLFGHIRRNITPTIFMDVAGGYGQNNITIQSYAAPPTVPPQYGQANFVNDNWFASFNAFYYHTWKKLLIRVNGGILYSEINNNAYFMNFQPTSPNQVIPPLTNRSTFAMEGLEIDYNMDNGFMPIVTAGLLQVLHYVNSRPLIITPINGSIPQLSLSHSAFRVGGGLMYRYKNARLRAEEKYYNSVGQFISYQTLITLEYQF